jgi:hypothetical protein
MTGFADKLENRRDDHPASWAGEACGVPIARRRIVMLDRARYYNNEMPLSGGEVNDRALGEHRAGNRISMGAGAPP